MYHILKEKLLALGLDQCQNLSDDLKPQCKQRQDSWNALSLRLPTSSKRLKLHYACVNSTYERGLKNFLPYALGINQYEIQHSPLWFIQFIWLIQCQFHKAPLLRGREERRRNLYYFNMFLSQKAKLFNIILLRGSAKRILRKVVKAGMTKAGGSLKGKDSHHSTSTPLWIQQASRKSVPDLTWKRLTACLCVPERERQSQLGVCVWQSDRDREAVSSPAIVVSCLLTYSGLTDSEGCIRIY